MSGRIGPAFTGGLVLLPGNALVWAGLKRYCLIAAGPGLLARLSPLAKAPFGKLGRG